MLFLVVGARRVASFPCPGRSNDQRGGYKFHTLGPSNAVECSAVRANRFGVYLGKFGIVRWSAGAGCLERFAACRILACDESFHCVIPGLFPHNPHGGLAELLVGLTLLGRLLGAGVCSLFQLVGLTLRSIEFASLLCHAYSFLTGRNRVPPTRAQKVPADHAQLGSPWVMSRQRPTSAQASTAWGTGSNFAFSLMGTFSACEIGHLAFALLHAL